MKNKPVFQKINHKMTVEGALNASLNGLAIGGSVSAVSAFLCMFLNASLGLTLGLALGLGIAVAALSAVLFYFLKYRPTERKMALRADAAGLEERAVTMLEFENDDSYIAQRQREDAVEHITKASSGALAKITVSVASVVAACLLVLTGTAMTTVSGLMAANVIPPVVIVEPPLVPEGYIAVSYLVDEGGVIEGDEEQLVLLGGAAEPVMAVAEEGWAFTEWSDGSTEPYRSDIDLTEDFTVTAIFEEVESGEGEGGESDGEGSESDGDDDSQKPSENEEQQNDQQSPSDEEQKPTEDQPENPENNAGSRYEEKNQIINGETYYRDVEYLEAVIEKLTSGEELSPEEREFIENYFGSI